MRNLTIPPSHLTARAISGDPTLLPAVLLDDVTMRCGASPIANQQCVFRTTADIEGVIYHLAPEFHPDHPAPVAQSESPVPVQGRCRRAGRRRRVPTRPTRQPRRPHSETGGLIRRLKRVYGRLRSIVSRAAAVKTACDRMWRLLATLPVVENVFGIEIPTLIEALRYMSEAMDMVL